MRKWKEADCLKRGKTRITESRLFWVLHLVGWEDGVRFLNQLHGKSDAIPDYFPTLNENCSNTEMDRSYLVDFILRLTK